MNFTVAEHNNAKDPTKFINYSDVEFADIPDMVTYGYCYCACKLKDNYRADNNFDGYVDVLIIDIDENCTIEQAKLLFKKYEFFLITSKSHQKDKGGIVCDRFRLFFKLDKTIFIRQEIEEIYKQFIEKYPFIDIKCKNVSRFFYSSPKNATIFYNKGISYKTYIPHSVTETAQNSTNDSKVVSLVTSDEIYRYSEILEVWITDSGIVLENEKGETSEEVKLKGIKKFLDDEFYQGNKGNSLFSAGCIMKKDGFDDDFIVDFLLKEWEVRNCSTDKFRDALSNIKNSLKY